MSQDLERIVLATALEHELTNQMLQDDISEPDVFTTEARRTLFKALRETFAKGLAHNLTLIVKIAKNGLNELEANEVSLEVIELFPHTKRPPEFRYFLKALLDDYEKRALQLLSSRISSWTNQEGLTPDEIRSKIVAGLEETEKALNLNTDPDIKEQYEETGAQLIARATGGGLVGLPTGLLDLDRVTGGYQRGHLTTIAGRPSMGKSALMLNSANHNAERGTPVMIVSYEMTASEKITRLSAIRGGSFDLTEINIQGLSKEQAEYWYAENGAIADLPLVINESFTTLNKLVTGIRKFSKQNPNGLVFIDHIGLAHGWEGKNYQGDTQMLTDISRTLKQTAKQCNIPIVMLSQLNRKVEERANKLPMLSDLKQSGSIEEDSNLVVFCYRPEYYDIESLEDGTSTEGLCIVKVAKNRGGAIGAIRARYTGNRVMFSAYE